VVHHGAVRRYRTTIAAIVVGVLVLATVAGFAIGLPKLVGEGGQSAADVAGTLPDEVLDGRLVRVEELDPEGPERIAEMQDFAAERFGEVFDTDAAVQIYAAEDQSAVAEVVVVAGDAGFFKGALPDDPDTVDPASGWEELATYGEVICYNVWGPEQQTMANDGKPLTVYCQREADGLTYDIRSGGLSPEDTSAALDEIVDGA
jgi:hypothetical protein